MIGKKRNIKEIAKIYQDWQKDKEKYKDIDNKAHEASLILQKKFDLFMEEFIIEAEKMGYGICLSDYPKQFPYMAKVLYPKEILVNVTYKY